MTDMTAAAEDIAAGKNILRILSCGSVDDGKSTLIGRMLHDCGVLYEDQLALLDKEKTSEGLPDFSCLLDGLLAEREQAITIDVAYRSFRTANRRYIVADAPGHEQYTRNMVTGASHADVALLLVDVMRAQDGLLPQTIRHTMISGLLGIPDIIVVINKMDCCGYERTRFVDIETEYRAKIKDLQFHTVTCIPASALRGDNVVNRSDAMPWYTGPTLLDVLEKLEPPEKTGRAFCMPVQWVAREHNFRGVSGTVVSGNVRVGQTVAMSPSGLQSTVRRIAVMPNDQEQAGPGEAICIQLEDDIDVGRGEFIVDPKNPPELGDQIAARVVWLNDPHLVAGRTYIFRMATAEAKATVMELSGKLNLNTLAKEPTRELHPNDIGWIKLSLDRLLPITSYDENHDLGGCLLVDRISGNTLGAVMIEHVLHRSHSIFWQDFELDKTALAKQKSQKPCVLWFTGLSASGKSTVANLVAKMLYARGYHVYTLDGDNLRHGLNRDLGFTENDRSENIRRASEVAQLMVDAGLVILASFISPYRADRMAIRDRFAAGDFYEIFMDTPLAECIARDPKGLYVKAQNGSLPNFTGISSPFEPPERPDLHLTGTKDPKDLAREVVDFLERVSKRQG